MKQRLTSKQRKLAKKYHNLSIFIFVPIAVIVMLIVSITTGKFGIGFIFGGVAIFAEGLYNYKIGTVKPIHGGKTRSFTNLDLFMYFILAIFVVSLYFWPIDLF